MLKHSIGLGMRCNDVFCGVVKATRKELQVVEVRRTSTVVARAQIGYAKAAMSPAALPMPNFAAKSLDK
jgi:hypothetical protein